MTFELSQKVDLGEVCRSRIATVNLLNFANENRQQGLFNDVEICTESDRFPANRMVLACFSNFFRSLFKAEMKEKYQNSVQVKCVDTTSVKTLIEYIYTGKININSENVCGLISASNYLQIDDVKQFCFDYLAEALSPDNCFAILRIAEFYDNNALRSKIVQIIADDFDKAATTMEFRGLTKEYLEACIKEQDKKDTAKRSLYNAIVEWTKHDKENRVDDFPGLLQLIKLDQLPTEFLENVVRNEDMVVNNVACSKMLLDAVICHKWEIEKQVIKMEKHVNGTRILSLGGMHTLTNVCEVYNDQSKSYPAIPNGRWGGCSVKLNDYLYQVGGLTSENRQTSSVWRLNLTEEELKWEEVTSMNKARYAMGATDFDGNLTVVGGDGQKSAEYYSPISNSWQEMSPLQQSRGGHALVACKDCLYAIGGSDNGKYFSSVEYLQSGDSEWKYVSPMQTPRRQLAAVCCDGFIYAIGGQADGSGDTTCESVEKYDPLADEWSYVQEMKFQRSRCSACVLKGRIFVVGGVDDKQNFVNKIECYDPLLDRWSIVSETKNNFRNHSLVVV